MSSMKIVTIMMAPFVSFIAVSFCSLEGAEIAAHIKVGVQLEVSFT